MGEGHLAGARLDDIDRHVGARVRMRRIARVMGQVELGARLGITFQQIQKYEKGMNRISAGKLYRIARILDVEPSYFFDGLDESNGLVKEPIQEAFVGVMGTAQGQRLVRALARLPDTGLRASLVSLVERLALLHGEPKQWQRRSGKITGPSGARTARQAAPTQHSRRSRLSA
jgi:transcriptional regulator with XRE-family HTH domain